MAWIKRNLFFVIGGILAIGLLGSAGFYIYKGWSRNVAALNDLNEIYSTLKELTSKKPSPGNEKINNIEAAKQQESQLREWYPAGGGLFQAHHTGSQPVQRHSFERGICRRITPDD